MNALILMVASTTVGINFGYQPTGDGGLEYIIQVEPDFCQSFPDKGISSEVPREMLNSIHRFRIVVGNDQLPRENLPPAMRTIQTPANTYPIRPISPDVNSQNSFPPATSRPPLDNPLQPRPIAPAQDPDSFNPLGNRPSEDRTRQQNPLDRRDSTTEASERPKLPTFADDKNTQRFTGYATAAEPERQWWALTTTLVALFASLGGNLYQGLAHFNLRQRYQSLVERVQSPARV